MARYHFRLSSLLTYRENVRDQCRQVFAEWLTRDAALVAEQQRLDQEREQQLDEMRSEQLGSHGLSVDRLASRRYRIGQLTAMHQGLTRQRQEIAVQMEQCRRALVQADQQVKVLERLSDTQRAEFLHREDAKESREREEIWQAGRGRGMTS